MLINRLKNYKVILASASPRRRELLAGLDIEFEVCKIDCDESFDNTLSDEEIALHIANTKVQNYHNKLSSKEILITADTIVVCDGKVIGKPKDREEAISMIRSLSSKTHKVITGVTINTFTKSSSFACTTEVSFDTISEEEILYYIDNYKPYDKAGSYGIQEWIGFVGIKNINGSYFNVMGLPIQRLYKELGKLID